MNFSDRFNGLYFYDYFAFNQKIDPVTAFKLYGFIYERKRLLRLDTQTSLD
ncbi:MAG TPA: hypothetical protein VK475_12840 [Pyrinomonadaceae bacterium]|nr:hypothetical protein [Pyrinomonadaceae bacterium]